MAVLRALTMALLAALLFVQPLRAQDITLLPTKDNTLDERNPTKNFGVSNQLEVKSKNNENKHPILEFDVSSVPSGALVTAATLTLQATETDATDLEVWSVTEAWVEGTQNNDPGVSNWVERQTATNWTTAGGTRGTKAATTTVITTGDDGPVEWDVTALVNDWIAGNVPNHGLLIKDKTEDDADRKSKFHSSETGATTSPKLTIEYTCPTQATIGDTVWSDVNGNGLREPGEPGLFGINVALLNISGTAVATTTTGIGGVYAFDCVPDGTFSVRFYNPAPLKLSFTIKGDGSNPTDDSDANPGTGITDPFVISGGASRLDIDAGFTGVPQIPGGVNGLFYGDGDSERYTLLSSVFGGRGALYGLVEGSTVRLAFVAGPVMNDNVFDDVDAAADPTAYMASVGWDETRSAKKLYDSEKLEDIVVKCGDVILGNWTQSYMCVPGDLEVISPEYDAWTNTSGDDKLFAGPLQGAGGLQEQIEFQPSDNLPSTATSNGDYTFGWCGPGKRDDGTPPANNYTAATSLAWNLNNTTWEVGTGDAESWKSPTTAGLDSPYALQYPYFDMLNLWEWAMVYEFSFDATGCTDVITAEAGGIHNSPAKDNAGNAVFPPGELVFFEWGDLPDGPYPTDHVDGGEGVGPSHKIVIGGVKLGTDIDSEPDGQPNLDATGDDLANLDDEDGVAFLTAILPAVQATIVVTATGNGFLNAWIDFNNDGTLDPITLDSVDGGAPAKATLSDYPLATGAHTIVFTPPGNTATGVPIYSRFRYTADNPNGALGVGGAWDNGEVEDYMLTPPSIDIEKLTNGQDADNPNDSDVPKVDNPNTVTWDFVVTNDGAVDIPLALITVSDDVIGTLMLNGAPTVLSSPYTGVAVQDGTDILDDILSPGESFTLRVTRAAEDLGEATGPQYVNGCQDAETNPQGRITYQNTGTVVIPGDTDSDDSHYCNRGEFGIQIEKTTNGNDADNPNDLDVPVINPGATVTWQYEVTNIGNTAIPTASISVSDTVIGPLMVNGLLETLPAPYTGVTFADDAAIQDGSLGAGESFVLQVTRAAENMGAVDPDASNTDEYVVGCTGTQTPPNGRPTYANTGIVSIPQDRDEDDSHYCGPPPAIDIEKLTNDAQADSANGADVPVIAPGNLVTWKFLVSNTGLVNIPLGDIGVSDNVIGTLMVAGALVNPLGAPYTGATFFDNSAIGDSILGPGESFTIQVTRAAENMGAVDPGDDLNDEYVVGCRDQATTPGGRTTYANTATVTIPTDNDSDDSHYCGPPPVIDIEKSTNGADADNPNGVDVPKVEPGAPITWLFVVRNAGVVDIPLTDIDVDDNIVGQLMLDGDLQDLSAPYTGVVYEDQTNVLDGVLGVGQTFTLKVTRIAEDLGQSVPGDDTQYVVGCTDSSTTPDGRTTYFNQATVIVPGDTDSDDSHYCNPVPSIDIEKLTNERDADNPNDADVPEITPGAPVTWQYRVTNDGNVSIQLTDINVTDNVIGNLMVDGVLQTLAAPYTGVTYADDIDLGDGILGPGESFNLVVTRTAENLGALSPGDGQQYVIGCTDVDTAPNGKTTYENRGTVTIPGATDNDDSHYCNPPPGIDIEKLTNGADADSPNGVDVPEIAPDGTVTWHFVVTNGSDVSIPLTDISVADDVVGNLMVDGVLQTLAAPYTGTSYADGDDVVDGTLDPGEAFTLLVTRSAEDLGALTPGDGAQYVIGCTDSSTAPNGKTTYANTGTVTIPSDSDSDDSHYCNPPPGIDIEKLTNGFDADDPNGADVPEIEPNETVTWRFVVTNGSDVSIPLTDISVTDDVIGNLMVDGVLQTLAAPYSGVIYADDDDIGDGILGPDEAFTLQVTRAAENLRLINPDAGPQYVVGCTDPTDSPNGRTTYENTGTVTIPGDSDSDPSHYCNEPTGGGGEPVEGSGSLGDTVWCESGINPNTTFDPADQDTGINGVTVTLYADFNCDGTPDGAPLKVTETASGGNPLQDGWYEFTKLLVAGVDEDDNLSQSCYVVEVDENDAALAACNQPITPISTNPELTPTSLVDLDNDFGFTVVPTAIVLYRFHVVDSGDLMSVFWTTTLELDTLGFNVYRSTTPNFADATKITASLIPGQGPNGGDYRYADKQLVQGVTYYYWLEEVENGGGRTLYGPTRSAVIENVGDFWHFLPLIAR